MGLDLAEDRLVSLQAQSEGWIAGLQLVALTLQRRIAGGSELTVSGRHRFIADYLSEDVLAPLPDAMQAFLLKTSVLDRLRGPLCNAVAETDHSQAMLEKLERQNIFLVSLDERREWFRYHHLFSDFLLEELQRRHPETVHELPRRAAA